MQLDDRRARSSLSLRRLTPPLPAARRERTRRGIAGGGLAVRRAPLRAGPSRMSSHHHEHLAHSWRRVLRFIFRRRRPLLVIAVLTLSLGVAAAFEPLVLKVIL